MKTQRIFFAALGIVFLYATALLSAQTDVTSAILAKSDTPISFVTWNGDGSMFATTWNNSVILWDAESNTVASVFSGHEGPVTVAKFSQDSKWLLTLGQDNAVIIRDMDYTVRETHIQGTGALPIRDAVFVDNGYGVVVPLDGFTPAYCYRLLLTQRFVTSAITKSVSPVYALDITKDGSKLLIAALDGTVTIFDLHTQSVINTFPRYALSQVPPRFTPDGNSFIAAADRTSLVLAPVYGTGALVLRDSGQPVNTVSFSADGTKVAMALKDGGIKVCDTRTGAELHWYTVRSNENDVVNSLSFSPDGEFLIAGTQAGYILRWSLSGKIFVPVKKSYLNKDLVEAAQQQEEGEAALKAESEPQKEPTPQKPEKSTNAPFLRQLSASIGFETLPSDDYVGSAFVDVTYRSFILYPFYFGFGGMTSVGIPAKDFTYQYNIGGRLTNPPYIYAVTPLALVGLAGYIEAASLMTFAEVVAGPSLKLLSNTDFSNLVTGDPYLGFNASLAAGVQWKRLRTALRVAYDSDFNGATVGLCLGYVWLFKNTANGRR